MTIFKFNSKYNFKNGKELAEESLYQIYYVSGFWPGRVYCYWPPYDKQEESYLLSLPGITKKDLNNVIYTDRQPEDGLLNFVESDGTLSRAFWAIWRNRHKILVMVRISGDTGFICLLYKKDYKIYRIFDYSGNGRYSILSERSFLDLTPYELGIISSLIDDAILDYTKKDYWLEKLFICSRGWRK